MKIWYPIECKEPESRQIYISRCQSDLNELRKILRYNINKDKVMAIQHDITESTLFTINKDFSVKQTMELFVASLVCKYDTASSKCYYTVSDLVHCRGTNKSLNFMIRLFEFGNTIIPQLNWIRHSYVKFKEYVIGRDGKS